MDYAAALARQYGAPDDICKHSAARLTLLGAGVRGEALLPPRAIGGWARPGWTERPPLWKTVDAEIAQCGPYWPGWRQGPGEDEIMKFKKWFRKSFGDGDHAAAVAYYKKHDPPPLWMGHVYTYLIDHDPRYQIPDRMYTWDMGRQAFSFATDPTAAARACFLEEGATDLPPTDSAEEIFIEAQAPSMGGEDPRDTPELPEYLLSLGFHFRALNNEETAAVFEHAYADPNISGFGADSMDVPAEAKVRPNLLTSTTQLVVEESSTGSDEVPPTYNGPPENSAPMDDGKLFAEPCNEE